MSLVSVSANYITKICQAKIPSHKNSNHKKTNASYCSCYHHYKTRYYSYRPISYSRGHKDLLALPLCAKKPEQPGGEEESRALKKVLKLSSTMKNENIRQLPDVIRDECQCLFNIFTSFWEKKQVVDFFTYLITNLGNRIDLVVTPTIQEGMKVRLRWKLEWKRTHMPLGKGFSIHISHVYYGKVLIRHVETFLEPLMHISQLRLVAIGFMRTLLEKMRTNPIFKDKPKSALYIVLGIVVVALLLLFGK